MSRMIKIKLNIKSLEITLMFNEDLFNQLNGLNTVGSRLEHDRCPVRIIGTDITRIMPNEFLKTNPGICLNHFQHMAEVNWTICIR